MRKRQNLTRVTLLFFLLLIFPAKMLAYTVGEIIELDDCYYRIISMSPASVSFLGCKDTKKGHLAIPAKIFDKKDTYFYVKEIGQTEAYYCRNITSVEVPEGVVSLKYDSFSWASLTTLSLPKSLKYISPIYAWRLLRNPVVTVAPGNPFFCNDADGALYSADMKTLYSVPSSISGPEYRVNDKVEVMVTKAINISPLLTSVVLPPNLREFTVDLHSSVNCNALLSVASGGSTTFFVKDKVLYSGKTLVRCDRDRIGDFVVPDDITEIRRDAFSNCGKINSIDLNKTVKVDLLGTYLSSLNSITLSKDLAGDVFALVRRSSLREYKVPAGTKNYALKDGVLFNKDFTKLISYPSRKEGDVYEVPTTVRVIQNGAFSYTEKLKSVILPSMLDSIGERAFEYSNLMSVSFLEPSKIKSFGHIIFEHCDNLKSVTLPKSLETLPNISYDGKLEEVIVPDGAKLRTIAGNFSDHVSSFRRIKFLGSCPLETIGENAFGNLPSFEGINFPKTVKTIGRNAFSNCKNMTYANFADDAEIETIGQNALGNCGLRTVTIPASVKTIEREAFKNCEALTTVNIPAGTTKVSPEAFKFCDKLTEINVAKDNQTYASVDGILLTKNKRTLVSFPSGKANEKFTLLPPSLTKIGDYAFYDCRKLTNVVIPQKVTSIGERAFGLCANLNTVTLLCDNALQATNIAQGENKMAFDDGTQAASMFGNITLYVRIAKKMDYLKQRFFGNFKEIKTSFLDHQYTDGTDEYINTSSKDVMLLAANAPKHTYVVPRQTYAGRLLNVSAIGDYAFQNNQTGIQEVVVGKHIDYIGAKAFMTDINHNSSSIQNVFFLGTSPNKNQLSSIRFDLDDTGESFNEVADNTNIYVKKSAWTAYRDAWWKESDYNYAYRIDYKVPAPQAITAKYGTFAREFDTDFTDFNKESGAIELAAFVAADKGLASGTGDYGSSDYHIRMTSIDTKGGVGDNYAYIPANTGVLFKIIDKNKNATPIDFYYTIGEKDDTAFDITNNIMHGVTETPTTVEASTANPVYVIQGGIFRKATGNIPNFPVHKAYMKLPAGAAGAPRIVFDFEDPSGAVTGVDVIPSTDQKKNDGFYYNLQGQRVKGGQKGIYIRDGKKVIVK